MTSAEPIRLRAGWVRGPAWDGFWMLSALWLAALSWFLMRDGEEVGFEHVDSIYFVLTMAFWIGHRVSSTYLAYCTTAYRPLLESQRIRFVWVPIGIVLLVCAILLPPDGAYPWTRLQRVMGLVILDYGLVTYHFAAQHYGCLSLYRVRAGQARSRAARRVDRTYALVVGGLFVLVAEVVAGTVALQDVWVDPWIDPEWLVGIQGTVRTVGLLLVGLAVLAMVVLDVLTRRPSVGRTAYVLGVALMVVAALYVHPFLFIVLWTAQHWMAAMGLASLVARGDPDPGPSRWYRLWHAVNRHAFTVVLLLVALSVILTPWMEVEALGEQDAHYGLWVFPFLERWLAAPWIWPILVSLGFITAFVHYTLDRAVFRLSDPGVRQAARGLLDTPSA